MKIFVKDYSILKRWLGKTLRWSATRSLKRRAKLTGRSSCSTIRLMTWSSLFQERKSPMSLYVCATKTQSSVLKMAELRLQAQFHRAQTIKTNCTGFLHCLQNAKETTMEEEEHHHLACNASQNRSITVEVRQISAVMIPNHRTSGALCKTLPLLNRKLSTQTPPNSTSTRWRSLRISQIVKQIDQSQTPPIAQTSDLPVQVKNLNLYHRVRAEATAQSVDAKAQKPLATKLMLCFSP